MMGRQDRDQGQLFYEFSLDETIPTDRVRDGGFGRFAPTAASPRSCQES
jgi:hypothetical protein